MTRSSGRHPELELFEATARRSRSSPVTLGSRPTRPSYASSAARPPLCDQLPAGHAVLAMLERAAIATEERIRAHVLLCWLSLLLIRLAEQAAGDNTWRNLRFELEKLHLGRFAGAAGDGLERTELTARQTAILKALDVPEPPRYARLSASQVDAATLAG
jgi:hypothetical protein